MCGVWAKVAVGQNPADGGLRELLNAIRVLAHRGPDGYAWFCEDRVTLAHLRLSIIDLEGGQQPLLSFNGRYVGIVNGELYDYQSLRTEMINSGIVFRTKSDSEVLLNLYASRGAAGLEGISGEFAFVFFDRWEQKIIFGRDPHGIKPLFMKWDAAEGLVLSSEVKALEHGSVRISQTYVERFLCGLLVPPETAVLDCLHVLPGLVHCFDIASQRFSATRFQKLPLNLPRDLRGSDAVEVLRVELKEAVRRRMVADVEVGCYLSGGLDSALIAAFMVEIGMRPKAFTVGFADKDLDERAKAAQVAEHLGLSHSVVELTSRNFFESLVRSIVAFENPIANPHGCAKNLLSQLAASQVKVVLSGEGADEWFGGYAYLRIQKLRKFIDAHPRFQGVLAHYLKSEVAGAGHLDGKNRFYDSFVTRLFNGHKPAIFGRIAAPLKMSYFTGRTPERLVGEGLAKLSDFLKAEEAGFGRLESEYDLNVWASLRTDMFHYILANLGDRQEMSHSLEGRVPFLDPRVTTVAGRIPPHDLLSGLTEKSPLRSIAKTLLPVAASTKKHAFFAPYRYFMLSAHREQVQYYLGLAREACPDLPWDRLSHFTEPRVAGKNSANIAKSVAIKMALFSVGVLVKELRVPQVAQPRGFSLPESDADLMAHRVYFEQKGGGLP